MALSKQSQVQVTEITRPRRRWIWLLSLAALLTITAIVVPIAVVFTRRSTVLNANVIVPLYIYPDGSAWDPLITAAVSRPNLNFTAVIDPDNGPDNLDDNYISGIQKLNSLPNVRTIGYVPLNQTYNPINETIRKVQVYASWNVTIHGIFFDEAPAHNSNGESSYIQQTRDAMQQVNMQEKIVVYNPGVSPDTGIYQGQEIVVAYEGGYAGLAQGVQLLHGDRSTISMIVHTIPPGTDIGSVVTTMVRNAGYIYATSNNGMGTDSPYANFSSIWSTFVSDMP